MLDCAAAKVPAGDAGVDAPEAMMFAPIGLYVLMSHLRRLGGRLILIG